MTNPLHIVAALVAVALALPSARAQTSLPATTTDGAAAADAPFARYVLIIKAMPGTDNSCSEMYNDDAEMLEQIVICSGTTNRGVTFSTVMPLYRKYPHRLVGHALDAIGSGLLSGEREILNGTARHHVRWSAKGADDFEIEETLLGIPGEPATPENAIGRYRYTWSAGSAGESSVRQRYENMADGFEQQTIEAVGLDQQSIAFVDTLRLCRRLPPQLFDHARERIAAGIVEGEHRARVGEIMHHVRWTAVPHQRFEIEETLSR